MQPFPQATTQSFAPWRLVILQWWLIIFFSMHTLGIVLFVEPTSMSNIPCSQTEHLFIRLSYTPAKRKSKRLNPLGLLGN